MKIQQYIARLGAILTPSALSIYIAVTIGVLFELVAIGIARVGSASIQQNVFAVHSLATDPGASYTHLAGNLSRNTIVYNLPLFIFYAGVGFIVYLITVEIYKALAGMLALSHELTYVNVSRAQILVQALLRIVVRIFGLGFFIAVVNVLLRYVLPGGLSAAHSCAKAPSATAALLVLLMAVLIAFCICLLVFAVRLIFLRSRLL